MSVKNKFCYICALRESQGKEANSSDHTCYKNWDSKMSASSMESAIIVEGFGMSEEMYGLKYNKLIGDGDSSVHKRLIEAHPYDNFEVQKIECKNHLLRNYAKKLREYTKKTGTPVSLRKALLNNIMKMRNAVTKASEHHRDQDCDDETKVNNLRRDIVNSIYHIFGDHSKCQSYYCSGSKPNETNIIKDFQTSGMMKKLQGIIWDLAKHSRSLIHNVDSNLVEQAFSLVAKLVGGKRTNVAHTYKARCSAAVISHNTGGKLHYTVHKNIFKSSPGKYAKIGEFLKVRKVALARARRQAVRNRNEPVISYKRRKTQRYSAGCSRQIDYGADAHQAPMSDVDLENAKTLYLAALDRTESERQALELRTRGQSNCKEWKEERKKLITASSFSKICKRAKYLSCAPIIKSIFYSNVRTEGMNYGIENENIARMKLSESLGQNIQNCGLFIHPKLQFIGASPDGITEDGSLVEIKCHQKAENMTPDEAVASRASTFWKHDPKSGVESINKQHDHYFQIQGQMHVTGAEFCYYVIYTKKEPFIKYERVPRDDNFWETRMKNQLDTYFRDCILSEIIDPQVKFNLPAREPQWILDAQNEKKIKELARANNTNVKKTNRVPKLKRKIGDNNVTGTVEKNPTRRSKRQKMIGPPCIESSDSMDGLQPLCPDSP